MRENIRCSLLTLFSHMDEMNTDYDNWCAHVNMIAFQYGEPDGNAPITIIDAGFTVIPAGSFTASAMLI